MIHWASFSDFIAMGGYGFYVWGSFGATVLIMAIEPIVAARNQRPPSPASSANCVPNPR
jgi:heme exporter protein D